MGILMWVLGFVIFGTLGIIVVILIIGTIIKALCQYEEEKSKEDDYNGWN